MAHAELRTRRQGGTWRVLETTATNLLHDPAVQGVVLNSRDVTARKEAEAALQASEARFRSLFANAREAIFFTRVDGLILEANEAALDLYGTTREEMLQLRAVDFYADPAERQGFQQAMAAHGAVRDYPLHMRRGDGAIIETLLTASVERDGNGRIVGYQGITRDVTAQNRAADALRRSEAYFRALTDHAADSIMVLSAEGTITYANPSFEQLLGYAPEARLAQSTFAFIHPDDQEAASATLRQVLHHPGDIGRIELRVLADDGSWHSMEMTCPGYRAHPVMNDPLFHYRIEPIDARSSAASSANGEETNP
jgi:PAS domain S-box-containing protein